MDSERRTEELPYLTVQIEGQQEVKKGLGVFFVSSYLPFPTDKHTQTHTADDLKIARI